VKATARRREGFVHEIETDDGHTIVVDEPVSDGGTDAGPSPTRLLAASLASCTAITIEMYGRRKGWDLTGLEVEVAGERDEVTHFDIVIRVPGEVDPSREKQILAVASKCPVHGMLAGEWVFDQRVESV
jgi:putative redox protein